MERSPARLSAWQRSAAVVIALVAVVPSTGCLHLLMATGIYLWEGGNLVDAECKALEGKRVVVVCRPPVSNEYRHAGAARSVASTVSRLLAENVKGIDVVNPREVDQWVDERDWGDYEELAKAVKADLVVHVELHRFELYKGQTLYQGNSDVTLSVYDSAGGELVWERAMGEVLFPVNSGIPAQDKSVQDFQRDYVAVLSQNIAKHFYKHDPNASFAMDALSMR